MNDDMQNLADLFELAQLQGIDVAVLVSFMAMTPSAASSSSGQAPAQDQSELPTLFYPH